MALPKRIPCPSLLMPQISVDVAALGPLPNLLDLNFATIQFPAKQSHAQFLDFWTTVLSKLFIATSPAEVGAACAAASAWSARYHIDGLAIRLRKKSFQTFHDREGSNQHPPVSDAEMELATRAMRAARLGPDARVSDVSKALRKGRSFPLDTIIIAKLASLYPPLNTNTLPTIFAPQPLADFSANRNSVAQAILSRSPNSHPGKTGISFGILQLFCLLTYKRESANAPDPRWSIFISLISLIMTGNASVLSPMLHTVVGIFFDKNFEKLNAAISLRNLGIEESLLRVAAAVVFREVIQSASVKGFLTCWDLGCGVKNGAEIFGRIAAVAADNGMIVAVFDIEKAFNNLQRSDIKDAVDNFNNPLLSAFVYFLFSLNPTVSFKDLSQEVSFTLAQGILQGNPLSTFLFALTICWILKPFRTRYPLSITPTFIDDLQLIGPPTPDFAPMLCDFLALFTAHGLLFDLSTDAKSSVFSVHPLPAQLQNAIAALGVHTQNLGITPCKIPYGNPNFIVTHVGKQQDKFSLRASAFKALWPALLKLKPTLRNTRIGVHESFLNLLRLSLLSMSTYTLRTVNPLFCAPYASFASKLSRELIDLVFPPQLQLIGHPLPSIPIVPFPPMMLISNDIMQLPLSMGGLSLRLPSEISSIAYAASCGECLPYLHATASRLHFTFNAASLPGLTEARTKVTSQLHGYLERKPDETISFERASSQADPMPLQEGLSSLFNHAKIVQIASALKDCPVFSLAFLARVDSDQRHCSWPFNPVARRNLHIAALADEDFSRAIQVAVLRPITTPRLCDCGAIIDPVGLHFLSCKLVHFGYLHDCVKSSIAATIKSFQPLDLSPLSVLMEKEVSRFYPLRSPAHVGPDIVADVIISVLDNAQHQCIIADVSSVLARGPSRSNDFHIPLRARSREKVIKYARYDIPVHLFHPITVGRTNVLSRDAICFCDFTGKLFPSLPKASDRLKAAISRATSVGAARTLNTAIKRAQLAAFNGIAFSLVPKSAACSLFASTSSPAVGVTRLRAALQPASDAALHEPLPLTASSTSRVLLQRRSVGALQHMFTNSSDLNQESVARAVGR
jgi:hypothetical protein